MLMIAPPSLTAAEWQDVRQMLSEVAACDCGGIPRAGSTRDRIGRAFHALTGHPHKTVVLPSRVEAVRRFICASGRIGRVAQDHVPTLAGQGFSHAQIDAIALLGA